MMVPLSDAALQKFAYLDRSRKWKNPFDNNYLLR